MKCEQCYGKMQHIYFLRRSQIHFCSIYIYCLLAKYTLSEHPFWIWTLLKTFTPSLQCSGFKQTILWFGMQLVTAGVKWICLQHWEELQTAQSSPAGWPLLVYMLRVPQTVSMDKKWIWSRLKNSFLSSCWKN